MTVRKVSGYLVFIVSMVTFFLGIICDFTTVKDAFDAGSISSYYPGIWWIDFLCCVVCFILLCVGLYKFYNDDFDNTILNLLMAALFIFSLALHWASARTITFLKDYTSGSYSPDSKAVAMVVFSIFAMISTFISLFIDLEEHTGAKKTFSVIGAISILIIIIISLSSGSTNAFSTVITVFELIFVLIALVYIFVSDMSEPAPVHNHYSPAPQQPRYGSTYSQTSSNYQSYSSSSNQQVNQPSTDVVKPESTVNTPSASTISKEDSLNMLKELKQLFDSEIITVDEYNEKRKKYLDLL